MNAATLRHPDPMRTALSLLPSATLLLGALLALGPTALPVFANDGTNAGASAAALDENAAKADLQALIERIQAKLQSDTDTTIEALAEELKAFDALQTKYAAQKTETVALIGVMKAMLFIEVLNQPEAGIAHLREVARDYPDTQLAARVTGMIPQIEAKVATAAKTAIGQPFPTFKEIATDGSTVDLAAYRGKVVLIDFWATWCSPCVQELPHVKQAYDKFHAQGFEIIGISLDKNGDTMNAFTKKHVMTWPQLFDGKVWESKLAQTYGVDSIPATFLIDQEGKIVAKDLRGDDLEKALVTLLAK